MINPRQIEEAIRDLEESSVTYNNCMKLASLYIIRDELRKEKSQYTYGYYHPMYAQGSNQGGNGRSNYNYRYDPMYYTNDDLMIRKQGMHDMHDMAMNTMR